MLTRLPVLFIILTVVIDAIGIGLIFPVMPSLIRELTGRALADAAIWGGVLATGFAVMQFLFGPLVGNLSDRFGRKPILLTALFVMMLDYLVMAVAPTIWLLLIGRLIAGITAATPGTYTAFMADISAPEDRERNFGYIYAAFGLGFAFGPMIGGLLAGIDTRAPFYAAAAIAGANMLFGFFVMPESLAPENVAGSIGAAPIPLAPSAQSARSRASPGCSSSSASTSWPISSTRRSGRFTPRNALVSTQSPPA